MPRSASPLSNLPDPSLLRDAGEGLGVDPPASRRRNSTPAFPSARDPWHRPASAARHPDRAAPCPNAMTAPRPTPASRPPTPTERAGKVLQAPDALLDRRVALLQSRVVEGDPEFRDDLSERTHAPPPMTLMSDRRAATISLPGDVREKSRSISFAIAGPSSACSTPARATRATTRSSGVPLTIEARQTRATARSRR